MDIETIPTDVSAATEQAPAPVVPEASSPEVETQARESDGPSRDPVTRREQKMAELAGQRREEVERERKAAALMNNPDLTAEQYDAEHERQQSPPEGVSAGQEAVAPSGEREVAAVASAPPPVNTAGWQTRADGVRVKTLMVNGQPREVTEEQYDRLAQKELAGDQKLRLAAEFERKLAERHRQLEAREQQLNQRTVQPPVQGVANDELEKMVVQHSELLLEGDTDAANALMVKIISAGRGNATTPSLDEIAEQAATRVERRQAHNAHSQSVQSGWIEFQQSYADVLADEDAIAFADIQIKRIESRNPGMAPRDVILEAGRITRERLKLGGGTQQALQTSGTGKEVRAEREERKANLRPIPKGNSTRNVPVKAPAVDYSPAAKIERMRTGRMAS